jgi:large subunit ribosomal protein L1
MDFKKAIQEARKNAKERKFPQTLELIVNLMQINTKTFSLNDTVTLPAGRGKKYTVYIVGTGDFVVKGKKCADRTVDKNEFGEFKSKKIVSDFTKNVDYFVVEATVMADFAKVFGQVLGPQGKMPLPHHIVPSSGDPCPMAAKLRKMVRVRTKKSAVVQVPVGTEKMKDEDLEKNARAVLDFLVGKLERGEENVKEVLLKFTMGPVVEVND